MTLKNFRMERIYYGGNGKPDFLLRTDDIDGNLKRSAVDKLDQRKAKILLQQVVIWSRFPKYVKIVIIK